MDKRWIKATWSEEIADNDDINNFKEAKFKRYSRWDSQQQKRLNYFIQSAFNERSKERPPL